MNAGLLISKFGVLQLEGSPNGYHLQSYINNLEIENYFLKGVGLANTEEFQPLNGVTFSIQKTGFYGETTNAIRKLNRSATGALFIRTIVSSVCAFWTRKNQPLC